jgi:hypothetical protein
MPYQITAIRLSSAIPLPSHEHIVAVRWTGWEGSGEKSTETVIRDIDGGTTVYVEQGGSRADVKVVRIPGRAPYIRTQANGRWTDNLLSLPRF